MTNMWAGKGMTVTFQSPPLNTILLLPPCLRELQNRCNIHTYTTVEITDEWWILFFHPTKAEAPQTAVEDHGRHWMSFSCHEPHSHHPLPVHTFIFYFTFCTYLLYIHLIYLIYSILHSTVTSLIVNEYLSSSALPVHPTANCAIPLI